MTITTPPTASYVRIQSRLRPEQVNASFADVTALESDIAARIATHKAVIEKKLSGVITTPDNQVIAAEALALRATASLYGSAGYLNPAYWERANALKAESADLIDDLTGIIEAGASGIGGTPTSTGGATLSTSNYSIGANGLLVVNG